MLPSLQLLEKVSKKIMLVPNRQKETKRGVHYGLFLLGYKSGLRVNEATRFDLNSKTRKGLYKISKCKGKKERLVYVPKKVIRELKKNNWKPNQTNRFAFYHFLRKIKRELNISSKIELSPHTLRRAFATYHAEKGLPLPLLQKLLGHSSIRTTALYWQNIYGGDDTSDILAGKRWLESKEPPKSPSPIVENLPENLETPAEKPIFKPNSPPLKKPVNYQPINEISPKSLTTENFSPLTIKKEDKPSKNQEKFFLTRIKELEGQLAKVRAENNSLKTENKHLKALIKQDQGTETKVIQHLSFKSNI